MAAVYDSMVRENVNTFGNQEPLKDLADDNFVPQFIMPKVSTKAPKLVTPQTRKPFGLKHQTASKRIEPTVFSLDLNTPKRVKQQPTSISDVTKKQLDEILGRQV